MANTKDTTPTKVSNQIIKRKLSGIVISDKMNKTIVVRVDRVKQHPKYKKRYTVSRRYKVHDEYNKFKEGDAVSFVQCRPLSKDKRWRALNSANNRETERDRQ